MAAYGGSPGPECWSSANRGGDKWSGAWTECAADEAADGQGGATTTYTPNYGKVSARRAKRKKKMERRARRERGTKKKNTPIKDEHVS